MKSKNIGRKNLKITITDPATQDFEEISAYIGYDNPSAAKRTINRIFEAIEYLLDHPNMGRTGRIKGTRELIISGTPFIVLYQVEPSFILILRVLHSSRKWPQ
jgi:toxin ParE1/3/4